MITSVIFDRGCVFTVAEIGDLGCVRWFDLWDSRGILYAFLKT